VLMLASLSWIFPVVVMTLVFACLAASAPTEALVGFDNRTNGFEKQREFRKDRKAFNQAETILDGLGRPTMPRAACPATRTPGRPKASRCPQECSVGQLQPSL
jgi:hypothetical protein